MIGKHVRPSLLDQLRRRRWLVRLLHLAAEEEVDQTWDELVSVASAIGRQSVQPRLDPAEFDALRMLSIGELYVGKSWIEVMPGMWVPAEGSSVRARMDLLLTLARGLVDNEEPNTEYERGIVELICEATFLNVENYPVIQAALRDELDFDKLWWEAPQ